ncbi:MarR family winged helix-turn-helix transcriptional regulator [Streptomyces sp. BI20]|uniref:MarR family winged helix-turn-helix transcriptional regulator n=1 Tax=Streptomyces sp. BI20 TaxID=3403460 RepID=UPI003C787E34
MRDTEETPADEDCSGPATAACDAAALTGPAETLAQAVQRAARLQRLLAGQLLRCVGLHPGQELVMMRLWELGPQRQIDLVRALGSDAATMTRTVRRLENSGFVRRRPDEADRRVVIVESTPAGRALRERVEGMWAELDEAASAGLSPAQREAAVAALARVETNLAHRLSEHPA